MKPMAGGKRPFYSAVLGGLTFLIACLAAAGWLFNVEMLRRFAPGMSPMRMSTAAGFLLAGLSLLLAGIRPRESAARRRTLLCLAAVTTALGSMRLFEYAAVTGAGMDGLLFPEPERMSLGSAVMLAAFGLSVIGVQTRTAAGRIAARLLIGVGAVVAFTGIVGYAFGVSGFYSMGADAKPLSLPAALAGALAFSGLWLALPENGMLKALSGGGSGGVLIRRLLLPIVLVPVALEVLLMASRKSGMVGEDMAVGVHVVLQTVIFLLLLRATAASVERADAEKREAMEELGSARRELEKRVETRTRELMAAEAVARAERGRLYDVMETLPVYVILLSPDYHVPYANRFFRERFGESRGLRCYEYLFKKNEPCPVCETFKVLGTGSPLQWEWTGPDGRNYAIYDFPFMDTDGSRLILEMGIDVTVERRLREGLERRTLELRSLANELTLAEQRERKRLAQVLHDHVQQLLVGAKLKASMLHDAPQDDLPGRIGDVVDLITQSIEASRTLTAELSPPILHDAGLVPALRWLGRWMKEKHGLDVALSFSADVPPTGEDLAALMFQCVRELLFNAAKHAKTGAARVDVSPRPGGIRVVVSDDGVGFDPSRLSLYGGSSAGFGLMNVRERLGVAGGSMEIQAGTGAGTCVTLDAPIPSPVPSAAPSNIV